MSHVWSEPVAFYFSVSLTKAGAQVKAGMPGTSFMEVSGIGSKMDTETFKEGGNAKWVYHLPTGVKYDNLVLKRGITPINSDFAIWCKRNLMEEGCDQIITGDVAVSLLGPDSSAICKWNFKNAYPVKWAIDALNSKKNELAIETIELCYGCQVRSF
jgi:phage tail-like protein